MEKRICSVCGELVSEDVTHCTYCGSLFVSVDEAKNEMLSDDSMYNSEVSDAYERYYL